MHPYNGGPPLARYLEIGEVRFNAEQKDEAVQWMFGHPREFALLTVQRIYYFWISPLKRLAQMLGLLVHAIRTDEISHRMDLFFISGLLD
jgi:hypothetical protein